jgi:hypothetical protein
MRKATKNPGRAGTRHGAKNATSMARNSHSSYNTTRVDFKAVNRVALHVLPALLERWLPGGRRQGREYLVRNPTRADRRSGSFKIAVSGRRAGMWADFATGDKGGDVISLAAYLFGLSQINSARKLAAMLGVRHD